MRLSLKKKTVLHAIALAIFVEKNKSVLAVKRPTSKEEYPGFWSIPTQKISQNEYEAILANHQVEDVVKYLSDKKLSNLSIKNIRVLKESKRIREEYDLKMIILGCEATGKFPMKSDHYDKIKPMTVPSILRANDHLCGTCVSMLHQYLIDIQEIDPGSEFLEIPPSLAASERPIEEYTAEDLWKLAAGNYALLLTGDLGGDGLELRSMTLDRAIAERLDYLISSESRFLDVGCGDGQIVRKVRSRTGNAYGIDLNTSMSYGNSYDNKRADYIIEGTIYSLKSHFQKSSFDVVLLNLVVQWIPDLDLALLQLNDIVAEKGKLIVTITNPNTTYCGRWRNEEIGYVWEHNRRIPGKKLVMINRMVGPLWYYGRSIISWQNEFRKKGFAFSDGEEIYLEDYQNNIELEKFISKWPSFKRSLVLPPFILFEFEKVEGIN